MNAPPIREYAVDRGDPDRPPHVDVTGHASTTTERCDSCCDYGRPCTLMLQSYPKFLQYTILVYVVRVKTCARMVCWSHISLFRTLNAVLPLQSCTCVAARTWLNIPPTLQMRFLGAICIRQSIVPARAM